MAKLSKRIKAFKDKIDRTKAYPFDNAVALIKEAATAKFNESTRTYPSMALMRRVGSGCPWFGRVACRYRKTVRVAVLLPVKKPSKPRQQALTWSVWKIWPKWSKPATCLSTS